MMRVKFDVRGIGEESRRRILLRVKEKYGFRAACRLLGISFSSMHRYLRGFRRIPNDLVERCVKHLDYDDLSSILSGGERLKAMGFLREDGSLDYSLVLEVVKYALGDDYLRQVILHAVAKEFPDDLKRLLGVGFAGIVLTWDDDFEYFLRYRKRYRRISDEGTIKYYRNLFMKYLEGRELNTKLAEYVAKHSNKWLRNVFRHYVQYLLYKRLITPEAYGWLTLVVPSRSYRMEPIPYRITKKDVVNTLGFLRKNHEKYYMIYRLMLESGARIVHAVRFIKNWDPNEEVEIKGIGVTNRLVVFRDHGFARYYVGFRDIVKRCEWVYMSLDTLELLKKYAGKGTDRTKISKYAKKHGLLLPKYMRKYSWRVMVKVLGREVARFLQSRFGELKISEARYEDLLGEADELYPKYLTDLERQIYSKL